jgi:cbb3-type cytochrome oxidase subunit 3
VSDVIWVGPTIGGGFCVIAISIVVILLLCILYKRKKKMTFKNKAEDNRCLVNDHELDVWF